MAVGRAGPPTPAAGCDCSVCPFFMDNEQAVEPICSGCNTDCDYCSCARAEASNPDPDPCGQCPIRCGSRPDVADWMVDVGGTLLFDDIDLRELQLPERLPAYIPQVDTAQLGELDAGLGWPAYAIGLRRVISPRTHRPTPTFADTPARQALGLEGGGQLAVLVGYGKDPLVEAVWTRRWRLYEQLARQQWDLVLAPNYSAYGNFPRFEQLYNFRRNLLVAQEMLEAGIPAVPNIYSFRLEDLKRYEVWLDRARPPAVAVNLQTQRADKTFEEQVLPGLAYLAQSMPDNTALIGVGSSRARRIAVLASLFDRLHLISQNALIYARHGAVMTDQGRRDYHAHTADAFAVNVRHYAGLLGDASQDGPADVQAGG